MANPLSEIILNEYISLAQWPLFMPKASDIFFLFFTQQRINLVGFPHMEFKKK